MANKQHLAEDERKLIRGYRMLKRERQAQILDHLATQLEEQAADLLAGAQEMAAFHAHHA